MARVSMPRLTLEQLAELQRVLVEYFNESELRLLCFELSKDYADLSGSTRAEKVMNLAISYNKSESLPLLMEIIQRQRPHIAWPEWLHGYQILEEKNTGYEVIPPGKKHGFGDSLTAEFIVKFINDL